MCACTPTARPSSWPCAINHQSWVKMTKMEGMSYQSIVIGSILLVKPVYNIVEFMIMVLGMTFPALKCSVNCYMWKEIFGDQGGSGFYRSEGVSYLGYF